MPSSMETGVKQVHIVGTDGQVPFQIASQYTPQEKVASGVSVGAGAVLTVATVDLDGFTTIGYSSSATTAHAHATTLWASPDGTKRTGAIGTIGSVSNTGRGLVADSNAQYVLIEHTNNDVAAQTYDVWARKMNR